MAILNATGRTAPDTYHIPTFRGIPTRVEIHGPGKIYRLVGSYKKNGNWARSSPTGGFWFNHTIIEELREDYLSVVMSGERVPNNAVDLIGSVRDGLAVSKEWSTLDGIVELAIPAGSAIEAWTGAAERQLMWQNLPNSHFLDGGFIQYLIYGLDTLPNGMFRSYPFRDLFRAYSNIRI